MSKNRHLAKAKAKKNDEFYTMYSDIEKELIHYKDHFKGKVIYCNCDDPKMSNFYKYFIDNFNSLGIKKVVSTYYSSTDAVFKTEYDGTMMTRSQLAQNGDFRSQEAIDILVSADIVITNPPFSLFREYVDQLIKYKKNFLILGNNNAITYKDVFSLIKSNKIWLGYHANKTMEFRLSEKYSKWDRIDEYGYKFGKVPTISWFTNLEHSKRNEKIISYKEYSEVEFPKYDNYDAINIDKVKDIPKDYFGIMGVPITFLTKHNPEQFEILGIDRYIEDNPNYGKRFKINNKEKYARILIQRRGDKLI